MKNTSIYEAVMMLSLLIFLVYFSTSLGIWLFHHYLKLMRFSMEQLKKTLRKEKWFMYFTKKWKSGISLGKVGQVKEMYNIFGLSIC